MSSETVSDERLMIVLNRLGEDRNDEGDQRRVEMLVSEVRSILTELQSLRSKPVASEVEVKPLEWVKHPNVEAWRAETMLGSYKVFAVALPATWSFYGHAGELIERKSPDVTEAKAAAEADYRNRILSALEAATAPVVSEPVAWGWADKTGIRSTTLDKGEAERWADTRGTVIPLYASPQLQQKAVTEEWQPIETAPRDGREVVLWCGQPVCGRISTDHLDPERTPQGWTFDVTWPGMTEPTHWIPIPAEPFVEAAMKEA